MKIRRFLPCPGSIALALLFLAPGNSAFCQDKKAPECRVRITSPKPDERVSAEINVEGTAALPGGGSRLWVFSHRKGIALWWPQGGGDAAVDEKGQWMVVATLGQDRDRGFPFEILAVVLSADESAKLEAWFRTSEQTGDYKGMRLPPFVESCGPGQRITVMKTN